MNVDHAYHILYIIALMVLIVLIGITLIRAVRGPRITDRILSVNMIGTMVICCISILSRMLHEDYLVDVALIYAMISFIMVLFFAMIYIPAHPGRSRYFNKNEITQEDEETAVDPEAPDQGQHQDEMTSMNGKTVLDPEVFSRSDGQEVQNERKENG